MRLPISALKEIGIKYGFSNVIVFAHDDVNNIDHIASWGKTIKNCDQSAQFADVMKDVLHWPESLHAMPNRVKKLQDQLNKIKEFHPRAYKLLMKEKPFVVVAIDEPYFLKVYSMIREQEKLIGRWTEEDEKVYQFFQKEDE